MHPPHPNNEGKERSIWTSARLQMQNWQQTEDGTPAQNAWTANARYSRAACERYSGSTKLCNDNIFVYGSFSLLMSLLLYFFAMILLFFTISFLFLFFSFVVFFEDLVSYNHLEYVFCLGETLSALNFVEINYSQFIFSLRWPNMFTYSSWWDSFRKWERTIKLK